MGAMTLITGIDGDGLYLSGYVFADVVSLNFGVAVTVADLKP